ncbi:hypothetical protein BS47DRAFT_724538 [Hydnum rufescens UP504]|uniref:Uncharacterized protein n=1 Tax=Hydnum rufescens UP504 TaxID=1448309 RepID=A0A9P6B1A8_9AGAM|nr:hypothetical protein BS47DRAFT_724538 [Hydnum rufescens UP504]
MHCGCPLASLLFALFGIRKKILTFLRLLQGLQTSCACRAVYWYLATGFGNFTAIQLSPWETRVPLAAGALGAFVLQSYLVWRIYQLNNSRILMCINAVLVFFSFAVAIGKFFRPSAECF